jgi:hypothetical protein
VPAEEAKQATCAARTTHKINKKARPAKPQEQENQTGYNRMDTKVLYLLLALSFAHFLGDFTPLNRWFIAAKRYGRPWWPVAVHGAVNGVLYGMSVWPFAGAKAALLAFAVETVTHTAVDLLKGRINRRFPVAEDPTGAVHWTVMGADQLLHQAVLILIACLCSDYF